MKYFLIVILTSAPLAWRASCQSTDTIYRFKLSREAALLGAGLSGMAASLILDKGLDPLSPEQIAALDREDVPAFDRSSLDNYSQTAHKVSNICLYGSVVMPLVLMTDKDIRRDAPAIALLFGEAMSLTSAVTGITKRVALRPRPYMYNESVSLEEKSTVNGRFSFFSGHASYTATMCFFAATVWTDYHPRRPENTLIWTGAATLPAITAYLRHQAGKHFLSDVVTGYAVGALIGYAVPKLHRIQPGKRQQLRFSSASIDGTPVLVMRMQF